MVFKKSILYFASGLGGGSELQLLLCDTKNLLSAALWILPEGLHPHTVRHISQEVSHLTWTAQNPATGVWLLFPGNRFWQSLNWKKTLNWKGVSNPHSFSPSFQFGSPRWPVYCIVTVKHQSNNSTPDGGRALGFW